MLSRLRWRWQVLVVGRPVHRASIMELMRKLWEWNMLTSCSMLLLQGTLRLLWAPFPLTRPVPTVTMTLILLIRSLNTWNPALGLKLGSMCEVRQLLKSPFLNLRQSPLLNRVTCPSTPVVRSLTHPLPLNFRCTEAGTFP